MQIGGRDVGTVANALFERRHYHAALNMMRLYKEPAAMFRRYLTGRGDYPYICQVKTPSGWLDLHLFTPHDVLTVNEIFCREDYRAEAGDNVIVDFGSNIGISAAYFLSRGPNVRAYLFEPLPANIERLQTNLARFRDRYTLEQVAVGPVDGEVEFGWEETGRYGGVGAATGRTITVKSRNSTTVLEEVIARHGQIDVLKVDIEGLEDAVVAGIPQSLARHIRKIYVECVFDVNPLTDTHSLTRYGAISQFVRR
ncbi:MAG TPA: FkbM family methyltransferase [Mycobacterium sp.]|nr:FkbM family methyltransferase [Mycobacterium sp.]